jgi:hypothetical protein
LEQGGKVAQAWRVNGKISVTAWYLRNIRKKMREDGHSLTLFIDSVMREAE